jgi:hypothetical protein
MEIFDRKELEEEKLNLLIKEERNEEKEKEIYDQKFHLDNLNKQLGEEILFFKTSRENDLLLILKKFFREKTESNTEITQIFT